FDNSQNEHFVIPDANVPDLGGSENYTSDQFTVGAWVYNDSGDASDYKAVMGTYDGANSGWALAIRSTDAVVFYDDDSYAEFASTVTDDTWTHVVVVMRPFSTTQFEYLLYINGQLVESDTTATNTDPTDGGPLTIGTFGTQAAVIDANDYDGGIDEPFIVADRALSQAEIKSIYDRGSAWLNYGVTDATTATSTTIGDSSMTWLVNDYAGDMVEIYGGTGAGQFHSIVSNTATVLTINPAFTTTPDTTSDFRIVRSSPVTSVSDVSDNGQRLLFGSNTTSDTGGAFEFTETNPYEIRGLNFYNYEAGISDDAGTAWASTYDDVIAVDLLDDNQTYLASIDHYYKTQTTKSLLDAVDDRIAESEAQSIRAIDDTGVQRNLVIRSGSYYLPTVAATTQDIQINYGIQFDRIPILVTNTITNQSYSTTFTGVGALIYGNTPSSFHAYRSVTGSGTAAISETQLYWIAMGPYTQPIGADLAEHYLTYDLAAEAGDVIAIDTQNDVAVTRSQSKMDKNAIGIVATKPGLVLGSEDGSTAGVETNVDTTAVAEGRAKTVEVALAGRVPVKVTLENGIIKKGDYLTPASKPGYAMKQTQAGVTIGRALEDFDGSSSVLAYFSPNQEASEGELNQLLEKTQKESVNTNEGKVMAFVQTGYYWGEGLTEEEQNDLWETYFKTSSNQTLPAINVSNIELKDPAPEEIPEIDPLVGLNITGEVYSPESGNSAAFVPETKPSSASFAFGTFSKLLADRIKAGVVEVNTKIASPIVETKLISPVPDESNIAIRLGTRDEVLGTSKAGKLSIQNPEGEEVSSIDSEGNATFSGTVDSQSLIAKEASIAGELRAGRIIADEIVNNQQSAVNNEQSITRKEIEEILHKAEEEQKLMAEAKTWEIDTVASSQGLGVSDSLAIIKSFSIGADFVIDSSLDPNNQPLTTINTLSAPLKLQSLALAPIELMAGKVRIDTNGDMIITGNLYVAGKIETKEVKTEKLIIASDETESEIPQLTVGEIETNATAGKATIPAETSEITIKNPNIGDYTLVYITPTSSTQNNVLYVKSKANGYFTVGFTQPIPIDVEFNWWVIDVSQ
ncbi:MAG: hypothetical protein UW85_C0013G0011, partial [Parcubacteria group bacterium GW2011_GWA1_Parcubacteria_45_10]